MKNVLAIVFFFAATMAAFAHDPITGKWELDQDIQGNVSTSTLALTQEGNKVSGSIKLSETKTAVITGQITEGKITFEYPAEWDGTALTMVYVGTIDAKGEMSGAVEVRPMGAEGQFKAKRSKQ